MKDTNNNTCSFKPTKVNGSCSELEKIPKDETIKMREKQIGSSDTLFFKQSPLKIVKGEGQYMYDENGNAYLDCINNVAHVGHCHQHVVKAGAEQMSLLSTNSRYLHDNLVLYAKRLTDYFPKKLSVCYFVNSGSEANDLAMRLSRAHTKNKDVICIEGAYHGHLTNIIDISPYKFKKMSAKQKKWVHLAPLPCSYNGMYRKENHSDEEIGHLYANEVKKLIDNAHQNQRRIAAFFAESMISCGGQVVLPKGYLKEVYEHVRNAGGVCVADEVQVGFGRVGDKFWAFELAGEDVCPDIVTIGKPIGNGHPVACVVTTEEIAKSFSQIGTEYFNTYGGNPVSISIANAVLDVIENEKLQENAKKVGEYMLNELERMKFSSDHIGDIRGYGMFLGVEIVKSKKSKLQASEIADYIVAEFKKNYILMSTEGIYGNILKFKPPMCFSLENAKHWLEVFRSIIETLNETVTVDLSKSTGYLRFNESSTGSLSGDSCTLSEDSLDSSLDEITAQTISVACN